MIKTILFDFDGVILDSMKIKKDGFKSIFSGFSDDAVKKIAAYHDANGGVSRFEKIRYFFNHILDREIDDETVQQYADRFAVAIEENLKESENLIGETVQFIQTNYQQYNMHIVSGAEHHELNALCKLFDLEKYFLSIEGSPVKKSILIKNILNKYGYDNDEIILIGDSINDYNAAKENDIKFYGYNNTSLKKTGYAYIESFEENFIVKTGDEK